MGVASIGQYYFDPDDFAGTVYEQNWGVLDRGEIPSGTSSAWFRTLEAWRTTNADLAIESLELTFRLFGSVTGAYIIITNTAGNTLGAASWNGEASLHISLDTQFGLPPYQILITGSPINSGGAVHLDNVVLNAQVNEICFWERLVGTVQGCEIIIDEPPPPLVAYTGPAPWFIAVGTQNPGDGFVALDVNGNLWTKGTDFNGELLNGGGSASTPIAARASGVRDFCYGAGILHILYQDITYTAVGAFVGSAGGSVTEVDMGPPPDYFILDRNRMSREAVYAVWGTELRVFATSAASEGVSGETINRYGWAVVPGIDASEIKELTVCSGSPLAAANGLFILKADGTLLHTTGSGPLAVWSYTAGLVVNDLTVDGVYPIVVTTAGAIHVYQNTNGNAAGYSGGAVDAYAAQSSPPANIIRVEAAANTLLLAVGSDSTLWRLKAPATTWTSMAHPLANVPTSRQISLTTTDLTIISGSSEMVYEPSIATRSDLTAAGVIFQAGVINLYRGSDESGTAGPIAVVVGIEHRVAQYNPGGDVFNGLVLHGINAARGQIQP